MKFHRRTLVLLLSLALILTASVSVTLSYLFGKTDDVENDFIPAYVSCQVVSENASTVSDNITTTHLEQICIKNTGNTDAYIKAKVVVTWKDTEHKNVHAKSPVKDKDYQINFADDVAWGMGLDGFYYFLSPVSPEQLTDVLITSCVQLNTAEVPEGYYLSVEVIASAIQTRYPTAVEQWSNGKVYLDENQNLVIR